jgi:GNAT superfamily N-acetyltransferase
MALLGLEQGWTKTPRQRSGPLSFRMQRLGREHRVELQDFLLRLDRDSRCRRFGHAASDDIVAAYAVTALEDASVIGVFVDEILRGALELYCCAPHGSEAALVVDQNWRRRGLGWALLRAAVAAVGEAQGIRLIFTRDNWPMRHLASKANARFDLVLDEICAEVTPARLRA